MAINSQYERSFRSLGTSAFAAACLLTFIFLPMQSSGAATLPDGACPKQSPVMQVKGVPFYTDKRASVVNAEQVQKDREAYKPVQLFVLGLARRIDDRDARQTSVSCALSMLDEWAKASAMEAEPEGFEAIRERARFTIGLNVIALKLRALGRPVPPEVLEWLRRLTEAAVQDFKDRPPNGNLYVWSGVDAASFAVLSESAPLREYASVVWRNGIAAIGPNGAVKSELGRGARALLYHQYYLAGLLMLRSYRQALGERSSPEDDDKVHKLASVVTDGYCSPATLKTLAGGVEQEIPPPYQFAVPFAFGPKSFKPDWLACAKIAPKQTEDSGFGGNMEILADILKRPSQSETR